MVLLTLGVALWFIMHGFKALFPKTRARMNARMGEEKAKGPFALGIFASIVLIIVGWRHADPTIELYSTPDFLIPISGLLILFALYLIVGSTSAIRIRTWIRHPQLTGFAIWSVAHLMVNGELRSVILFAGFAAWAVTLIPCINRRDGAYTPPTPEGKKTELKPIGIAILVFAVLKLSHGFYTAQSLIPW